MDAILRRTLWALFACVLSAQVIEFEQNGLKYQTLTRESVTVMYASMSSHVTGFSVMQVAVANGSGRMHRVRPEDFVYYREGGEAIRAVAARTAVTRFIEKGGRGDVIKLVSAYEAALYGLPVVKSTNGYETRRQQALAEVASTKLKAAAAASAIVFIDTRLGAGQSTDGAIFFPTEAKALGPGRLVVRNTAGEFSFNAE